MTFLVVSIFDLNANKQFSDNKIAAFTKNEGFDITPTTHLFLQQEAIGGNRETERDPHMGCFVRSLNKNPIKSGARSFYRSPNYTTRGVCAQHIYQNITYLATATWPLRQLLLEETNRIAPDGNQFK